MGRLLLVRHGQASWGADDYDVLSPLGHQQAAALGEIWQHRGLVPDRIVIGGMRRHRETCEAAGLVADEVDAGWDEFDHVMMLARVPAPDGADTSITLGRGRSSAPTGIDRPSGIVTSLRYGKYPGASTSTTCFPGAISSGDISATSLPSTDALPLFTLLITKSSVRVAEDSGRVV